METVDPNAVFARLHDVASAFGGRLDTLTWRETADEATLYITARFDLQVCRAAREALERAVPGCSKVVGDATARFDGTHYMEVGVSYLGLAGEVKARANGYVREPEANIVAGGGKRRGFWR